MSSTVFQSRAVKDVDYKISAIDYFENALFVGDQTGSIYRYPLNIDDIEIINNNSNQIIERLTKSKIEVIRCISFLKILLVLSDGTLHILVCNTLKRKWDPILNKSCATFCINEFNETDLLVITKKKEGVIFKFNTKSEKFEKSTDAQSSFNLPDIPVALAWTDKKIIVGYAKREYILMNSTDFNVQSLPVPIGNNPFIKVTDKEEFLLTTKNNLGVYLGIDGNPRQKATVQMNEKPIVAMSVSFAYLVVLFENLLQVFNILDSKLLQEINLTGNNTGKCLTTSSDKLFMTTMSEIVYLYLTPYESQIKKCLIQTKIEDAFSILDLHVGKLHPDREKKENQLKLDAGWALIKDLNFKQARFRLESTSFDPREILSLFPEYHSNSRSNVFTDSKKQIQTMSVTINNYLTEKLNKKDEIGRELARQTTLAKEFLLSLLENRRSLYITEYPNLEEKLVFYKSTESINGSGLPPSSVLEILEHIDFALIKLYMEFKQDDKLKAFFSNKNIYCRSQQSELELLLSGYRERNPSILAKFYGYFGKNKEALEIWKQLIKSAESKVSEEACEETINILKDVKDKKIIFEYLKSVLTRNQAIGAKLFYSLPEAVVGPDQMMTFFQEFDNPNLSQSLKERYLEIVVNNKKAEDERFHTLLGLHYLEILFKLRDKTSTATLNPNDSNAGRIDQYQRKLDEFLKNPDSKYRAKTILDKIRDSWLVDLEIYLLGKEKLHKKAMKKLVKSREFLLAEQYCADKTENLLTQLFEIYMQIYRDSEKRYKETKEEVVLNYLNDMKKCINNFLKKYATHSQLDPLLVLANLPEDWVLAESEDDGLFTFLSNITSHTLNQRRTVKCAKHLSEMDLLNVECNLVKAKKAHIKITAEKNCSVCNRRIGDKVFVVYPNGVTAHHTCVSNKGLSTCPLTGQNFEKTFKL